jgi:hypothetical protein
MLPIVVVTAHHAAVDAAAINDRLPVNEKTER